VILLLEGWFAQLFHRYHPYRQSDGKKYHPQRLWGSFENVKSFWGFFGLFFSFFLERMLLGLYSINCITPVNIFLNYFLIEA